MANSSAQLKMAPISLPAAVPAEPVRIREFQLVGPWPRRATLLAADVLALSMTVAIVPAAHLLLLLPFAYAIAGLYPVIPAHSAEELRRIALVTVLAFVLAGATASGTLASIAAIFLVAAVRHAARGAFSRRPWWGMSTVVLAPDRHAGAEAAEVLSRHPALGLKPVALLHGGGPSREPAPPVAILGPLEFAGALSDRELRCAVVALRGAAGETLEALHRAASLFEHVLLLPHGCGSTTLHAETADFAGTTAFVTRNNLLRPAVLRAKTALEQLLAILAIGPAILAGAVIAVLIKATSRGPVLYTHERIGRNGRAFAMLKFRTMVTNADRVLELALRDQPALRREWDAHRKLQRDPRVTRLGAILRRTSLDELPQLINVLRGEMSLVGPRPVVASELRRYGRDADLYCAVRPGITGLWQVSGRNDIGYDQRVQLDAWYVRNWSVWLDLDVLLRTVWVVLRGRGAY